MASPLDDIRGKIDDAKSGFDALQAKIVEFLNANQRTFEITFNADTGEERFEGELPPLPPNGWSRDIGRIAHDLRSSLDHLVFELAYEGGGDPEKNRTSFPIATVESEYWKERGKRGKPGISFRDQCLTGVCDRWKLEIDDLQPYHSALPDDHPLARLNWLNNRDKHREGIPIFYVLMSERRRIFLEGGRGGVARFDIRLSNDHIDARVELRDVSLQKGRGMGLAIAEDKPQADDVVGLAFALGRKIKGDPPGAPKPFDLFALRDLILYVEHVIGIFEPAFQPPSV